MVDSAWNPWFLAADPVNPPRRLPERGFLAQLSRVLIPGGHLLITTPHKGLLTFLDAGNFKFSAPGLHRFLHCTILRNREYYEQRFGDARRRDLGMLADFTLDQSPWHRHYSAARLRALAPPQLHTVAWSAYYPAYRAIESLFLALKVVTRGRLRSHLPPAPWVEKQLSRCMTILGDQLVMLFQKRKS